jgi:predicted transcriptional regulator
MLESYLDQMMRRAEELGVDFEEACDRAEIVKTTRWRWQAGTISPREGTALKVLEQIEKMAAERRQKDDAA